MRRFAYKRCNFRGSNIDIIKYDDAVRVLNTYSYYHQQFDKVQNALGGVLEIDFSNLSKGSGIKVENSFYFFHFIFY